MKEDWMKYCINCPKPTRFIRHTQFAGSHPYCEDCAKDEPDFMKDDEPYKDWEAIS